MKRIFGLTAAATLAGCAAIADGPSASTVVAPSSFVYVPVSEPRGVLETLLPSRDPAFKTLLTAVDADAPDLQIALARIEAARAALLATGAVRAPNVGFTASATGARSSETAVANLPPGVTFDFTNSSFSSSINASWDLDLFGRLRALQRAASFRLDAANADARAVRLAVVTDIARGVIDYRTAQAELQIIAGDVDDAAALVKLTSVRTRAGIAPGLDLVRAQSLEAAAQSQRGPAEADRAAALGRLVALTARDSTTIVAAFQTPAETGLTELPSIGLPSALLQQRPDIVAAEKRLSAANAEIAAAAAARFPQISVNAALGLAALALGDLFSADSVAASIGGTAATPLLSFGRVGAQIDGRQADAKEAFGLYRQAVFTGIGEAETALGSLQANRNRLSALQAQLRIEQVSVALSTARYGMGLGDFLSVLDAQRQLQATRQSLVKATGAAQRSQVIVYRSFGG